MRNACARHLRWFTGLSPSYMFLHRTRNLLVFTTAIIWSFVMIMVQLLLIREKALSTRFLQQNLIEIQVFFSGRGRRKASKVSHHVEALEAYSRSYQRRLKLLAIFHIRLQTCFRHPKQGGNSYEFVMRKINE